jgi:hypothetical protein
VRVTNVTMDSKTMPAGGNPRHQFGVIAPR